MRLWMLGSGSKGNAVLVESGDTRVLVDAGFSARRLAERLTAIGIAPASVQALLLTHEHSDHVSAVQRAVKRWKWPVHATEGTLRGAGELLEGASTHVIARGVPFTVGDLRIEPFGTSHDAADPVGFVATSVCSGARTAVVTDLGCVTDEVRTAVQRVDVLVLESNHDEGLLESGPYPWHLKRRVGGKHGHLSNRAAGELSMHCLHKGLKQIVLAHLSETNNSPAVAHESMQRVLRRTRYKGELAVAPQHGVVGPFGDGGGPGGQLTLF
ncbi:beta-lactamase domain protein [Gemmatirosa kalamazoonensis]|uniref:Beta-lactamase domain protein n=1 Tax=Gemmatirosa kalamazoonensis TaxID=861299 RepID=W0RIW7_9BACT|nr:MBL fold metallo-hydrolase [Gemmatirosa kalamazoonensis]AHG90706.1 beta-lactamase domain protein [Gemmatirosa kalamazoonensis]